MDRTLQGLAANMLVQAYATVEVARLTSPDSCIENPYREEILRRLEQTVPRFDSERELTGISWNVALPTLGQPQRSEYGKHEQTLLRMLEAAAS